MATTIINLEIKVQMKGSNGKRRRRTEDPEDWSRTRGQQWTTEVSLDFFVQSVLILSSGSTVDNWGQFQFIFLFGRFRF